MYLYTCRDREIVRERERDGVRSLFSLEDYIFKQDRQHSTAAMAVSCSSISFHNGYSPPGRVSLSYLQPQAHNGFVMCVFIQCSSAR